MIGKGPIILDRSDFIRGMATSAEMNDGGLSPETNGVNLIAVPGVLNAPASAVDSDTDTRLTGNLIASSPDMNVTSPTNRLWVSDDGKFYRYDGTKLDAAGVSLTAGKTWSFAFTDIITFGGEAYISSKESLSRLQNDNTLDAGGSWPFNFTTSSVPHPGIVYENNMYWGDKNLLLSQASVGDAVAPTTILTLSADQVIMALGVDPGTGLMLISTSNALDVSSTIAATSRLLWYDGNSAKVVKSVIVEAPILGFQALGGTVFVGYGQNIGYINGSGIQFLRKLQYATLSSADLPYKHHMTVIGNTLYVADGKYILAYGDVMFGQKAWYYCKFNWENSSANYGPIASVGSGKLGLAFATNKFFTFDTTSVATTASGSVHFPWIYFPRPVQIRSAVVEYYNSVAAAATVGELFLKDQTNVSTQFSALTNNGASGVYSIETKDMGRKVTMAKVRYNFITSTVAGVRRILIYYDVAE